MRIFYWKNAIWSGIIAGLLFMMLEMLMIPMFTLPNQFLWNDSAISVVCQSQKLGDNSYAYHFWTCCGMDLCSINPQKL